MSKRKTIEVRRVVDICNLYLRTSNPDMAFERKAVMNVCESILFETVNYKGFRYLLKDECEGNPGINYEGEVPHPDYVLRFSNCDETRVEYYS